MKLLGLIAAVAVLVLALSIYRLVDIGTPSADISPTTRITSIVFTPHFSMDYQISFEVNKDDSSVKTGRLDTMHHTSPVGDCPKLDTVICWSLRNGKKDLMVKPSKESELISTSETAAKQLAVVHLEAFRRYELSARTGSNLNIPQGRLIMRPDPIAILHVSSGYILSMLIVFVIIIFSAALIFAHRARRSGSLTKFA